MQQEKIIEKERQLIEELRNLSLCMLQHMKKNGEKPIFDTKKAREVIERIFNNELDYLIRESDHYYELYLDDDLKNH